MDNIIERIDVLNRDEFIERIIKIIYLISNNKGNMTFAINGKWGSGKTFVLNKIIDRIKSDTNKKILVIPYNCWQYDYYQEPLIAIVAALVDFASENKKVPKSILKSIASIAGNVAKNLVIDIVKNKTGVDATKAFDFVKETVDNTNKNDEKSHEFDTFFGFKEALKSLKVDLEKISSKYTLLFVVDELDRCLPEYSIKVLERLHHITESVPNVITIISVDKKRLENTVTSIFGENDNNENTADLYLKKFIRFEVELDIGKQNGKKFFDKYPEFCDRFDISLYGNIEKTEKFIEELFRYIEIRSQEQIVEKATIIHDICFGNEKQDYTVMFAELFIATLYYYYHDDSIFYEKKVTKLDNVFSHYTKTPKAFSLSASGFNFSNATISSIGNAYHFINIDVNNIFMIIYTYWHYSSIASNNTNHRINEYVPKYDDGRIDANLKKIRKFVEMIKIIK